MRMIVSTAVLAALVSVPALSTPHAETAGEDLQAVIAHLLEYVATSDVVFIRNGKEHSAADAADHIRKKYNHYKDRIETPEDFIRLSATKSMMSGKPYTIRLPDGTVVATKEWLEAELARYRVSRSLAPDSTRDSTRCEPDSSRG